MGMRRNCLAKFLPVAVVVCMVFSFLVYTTRVEAGVSDKRYHSIMYSNYVMGTIYDANNQLIACGTSIGDEVYGEGMESAYDKLIGLSIDHQIAPYYTVRGKYMQTLYGGKQNRMKLLNPFTKKIGSDIKLTTLSNLQCYVSEMLEAENFPISGCLVMNYRTGEVVCAAGECFYTRKMVGSTIKPILYAALLEENPLLAERNYICAANTHEFDGLYIQCYGNTFHGSVDMKKALTVSCNGAAAAYSKQIDESILHQNLQKFGFDIVLAYPGNYLSFADSTYWGGSSDEIDSRMKLMSTIGGGNCTASPASLAVAYSALFNEGVAVAPYIVSGTSEYHGESILDLEKNEALRMCSSQTANTILDMMVSVVENGTARGIAIEGVKIAAKTGTANYDAETNVLWLVAGILDENAPYLIVSYADKVPTYLDTSSTLGSMTKNIMEYLLEGGYRNEFTESICTEIITE